MSDEKKVENLEMRIVQLEDELKSLRAVRDPGSAIELDAESMEVFRSISKELGWDPDTVCGINECDPCIVLLCGSGGINFCGGGGCVACVVCYACINECDVCLNVPQIRFSSSERFRQLGDS